MFPLRLTLPLAPCVFHKIVFLIMILLLKLNDFKLRQRHYDNCITPYSPMPLLSDLNIYYVNKH